MASQQQQLPLPPIYHHVNPLLYHAYHPVAGQLYHDPAFQGLGYRVQHEPPTQQQQHVQQQQQSFIAAGAAAAAASSGFNASGLQQRQYRLPIHTRPQQPQQHVVHQPQLVMASEYDAPAGGMTEEEIAQLQKLSNEYEPEAKGPLVGHRQSSTAITEEYARADAKYQVKTASLPHKYSHYRTVRGDGKCGWRAIAYGYFETLIHLGDGNKFVEEEARLRSLVNTCNAAGYDVEMVNDFADATFDLLRKVAQGVHDGTAEDSLHEEFNDEMIQNYIITHFRTLTAAWMKTHQNDYAPWILDQSIDEYVNMSVLPIACELEHVSMTALKDVLLSPAGITLEVNYLDRSDGEEINMHRMGPAINGYDIGTIRLLYRPGHYDLLYMLQDFPPISVAPPTQPAVISTYLINGGQLYPEHVYETPSAFDWATSIPGGSYVNSSQSWLSNSSYSGGDFFSLPVPQIAQPVAVPLPTPQPQMTTSVAYTSSPPTQLVAPPMQMPEELAVCVAHTTQPIFSSPHPFRPSQWQAASNFNHHMPLQTAQFKNSHFNTAHFKNPDFQPDQWHPDDEHRNSG